MDDKAWIREDTLTMQLAVVLKQLVQLDDKRCVNARALPGKKGLTYGLILTRQGTYKI